MARNGLVPDLVLCSTARRARETWELVAKEIPEEVHVEMREDLYFTSPAAVLGVVQALPDSVEAVLLVGHNPTFEDLAMDLAGHGPEPALQELYRKYPTGALAILDFPVEKWLEVRGGVGILRDFVRPRALSSS